MTIQTDLMRFYYEDRAELTRARMVEDNRLIAVVEKFDDAALATPSSNPALFPLCRPSRGDFKVVASDGPSRGSAQRPANVPALFR